MSRRWSQSRHSIKNAGKKKENIAFLKQRRCNIQKDKGSKYENCQLPFQIRKPLDETYQK